MGCSSSKGIDSGPSSHHSPYPQQHQHQHQQQQQQQRPQDPFVASIPPSTLPPGWISQFDSTKQRLYYVYFQTKQVTWAHPCGPQADAQEMARFYQIQKLYQQQYGGSVGQGEGGYSQNYTNSYNRQGGMGTGAAMALGLAGGLVAGSVLVSGLHDDLGYAGGFGGDVVPANVGTDVVPAGVSDFGGGGYDFGGGGDFGGGF
ncbi:hypothetical protein BG004_002984 [Podila humilis]|nr:hypothetical protein BG004_002984 [Podila humilis]